MSPFTNTVVSLRQMEQSHDSSNTTPRKRRKLPDYNTKFRVQTVALAELERNNAIAGEVMNVPRCTVARWRAHPELQDPLTKAMGQQDLVNALEALTWMYVDASPLKIEDASLSQVAHAMSVAIDKMQLLRGAPTSIPGKPVDPDTLRARIRDILLDKAKHEAIDPATPQEQAGVGGTEETVPSGRDDREGTDEGTQSGILFSGSSGVDSDGVTSGPDGFEVTSGLLELE